MLNQYLDREYDRLDYGVVQEIVAELLPILTAGHQPDPTMLADHTKALERLKKLQNKVDELRNKLKTTERAVNP